MAIKHTKTAIPDVDKVDCNDWNANHTGTLDHTTDLTNVGTLTHAQIDNIHASRISVARNPAQTFATGTPTIVQFDVEIFDNLGEYDHATNYNFIAQNEGYYLVIAHLVFGPYAWAAGKWINLRLYRNGANYKTLYFHKVEAAITTGLGGGGSAIVYLNAEDVLDIRMYHNRGANTNTAAGVLQWNYFMVHRLS